MKKNQKFTGFTLIELVIAVAIVGILASIALPSYLDTIREARRADGYDALLACASAQARRYSTTSPQTYMDEANALVLGLCGADTSDNNFYSKERHYQLTITNTNCLSNNQFWCFSVTATAIGSQAADTDCASLTVDYTGNKTHTPTTSTESCWKS